MAEMIKMPFGYGLGTKSKEPKEVLDGLDFPPPPVEGAILKNTCWPVVKYCDCGVLLC